MSWQQSLNSAIRNLRTEQQSLERDLERVREAINTLEGLTRGGKAKTAARGSRRQRRLSPEGRDAIARAARKRWAKWRAEQKA